MAATTAQLIALGSDSHFRERVRTLFLLEAGAVYGEAGTTPNHGARALFASKLFVEPSKADALAAGLATRTNIAASTVTYDFDLQAVLSSATDLEIRSQIATDWNLFAAI